MSWNSRLEHLCSSIFKVITEYGLSISGHTQAHHDFTQADNMVSDLAMSQLFQIREKINQFIISVVKTPPLERDIEKIAKLRNEVDTLNLVVENSDVGMCHGRLARQMCLVASFRKFDEFFNDILSIENLENTEVFKFKNGISNEESILKIDISEREGRYAESAVKVQADINSLREVGINSSDKERSLIHNIIRLQIGLLEQDFLVRQMDGLGTWIIDKVEPQTFLRLIESLESELSDDRHREPKFIKEFEKAFTQATGISCGHRREGMELNRLGSLVEMGLVESGLSNEVINNLATIAKTFSQNMRFDIPERRHLMLRTYKSADDVLRTVINGIYTAARVFGIDALNFFSLGSEKSKKVSIPLNENSQFAFSIESGMYENRHGGLQFTLYWGDPNTTPAVYSLARLGFQILTEQGKTNLLINNLQAASLDAFQGFYKKRGDSITLNKLLYSGIDPQLREFVNTILGSGQIEIPGSIVFHNAHRLAAKEIDDNLNSLKNEVSNTLVMVLSILIDDQAQRTILSEKILTGLSYMPYYGFINIDRQSLSEQLNDRVNPKSGIFDHRVATVISNDELELIDKIEKHPSFITAKNQIQNMRLNLQSSVSNLSSHVQRAFGEARSAFKQEFSSNVFDLMLTSLYQWAKDNGISEICAIRPDLQTAYTDDMATRTGDVYKSTYARCGMSPPASSEDPYWRIEVSECPMIHMGEEKNVIACENFDEYRNVVLTRTNPGNEIHYDRWEKEYTNGRHKSRATESQKKAVAAVKNLKLTA